MPEIIKTKVHRLTLSNGLAEVYIDLDGSPENDVREPVISYRRTIMGNEPLTAQRARALISVLQAAVDYIDQHTLGVTTEEK